MRFSGLNPKYPAKCGRRKKDQNIIWEGYKWISSEVSNSLPKCLIKLIFKKSTFSGQNHIKEINTKRKIKFFCTADLWYVVNFFLLLVLEWCSLTSTGFLAHFWNLFRKGSLIMHFVRLWVEISLTRHRRELGFVLLAQFHRVIGRSIC